MATSLQTRMKLKKTLLTKSKNSRKYLGVQYPFTRALHEHSPIKTTIFHFTTLFMHTHQCTTIPTRPTPNICNQNKFLCNEPDIGYPTRILLSSWHNLKKNEGWKNSESSHAEARIRIITQAQSSPSKKVTDGVTAYPNSMRGTPLQRPNLENASNPFMHNPKIRCTCKANHRTKTSIDKGRRPKTPQFSRRGRAGQGTICYPELRCTF